MNLSYDPEILHDNAGEELYDRGKKCAKCEVKKPLIKLNGMDLCPEHFKEGVELLNKKPQL